MAAAALKFTNLPCTMLSPCQVFTVTFPLAPPAVCSMHSWSDDFKFHVVDDVAIAIKIHFKI